ncbi:MULTISPECIES: ABC transporter permease subunit [Thermotoga]|uniref:ABC transporter, permease protein n=1 Tax=Thermotoga neapolitana (strain ATCC 49049 / DSM 4359 / NBRC 107923 / NS-E) TaxID=309803 RepID=B9K9T0_THENN|nr:MULTISPECIES: ABC transporter permease subunit [Thermotoga]MDK2785682.1 beta-exotoxin transport system permease protein [Thermotoga sp.]HBF10222.1 ABC transporter permease [Thermotoga neapolitana]ACM23713.1 ABC transporter, permease protein [Thermotoga neapolitana DSM 4359]AJG41613.1 ABC transporter permease [Thermotoga sp. RQ7]KFZ21328.1 ABC transporter permease [Thermotoga neapolitana LA10]
MNVLRWDLKRYIKSTLAWTIVLILLQFMYAAFYPSMAKETELITRWIRVMPKAFVKLFGLEDMDFSNIMNYLAMVSSIYVTLVGGVFASLTGVRSISREENEKTMEFLLSKPITRYEVVLSKFASSLIHILIFDVLLFTSLFFFANAYSSSPVEIGRFTVFALSQTILHITLMNISFLVGALRSDNALSLGLGTTFVLYVLNMISKLTDSAEFLKYFTPFSYADPSKIIRYGFPEYSGLFFALVNVSLLIITVAFFSRKDILV